MSEQAPAGPGEKLPEWLARNIAGDIAGRRLPAGSMLPAEQVMTETFGVGRASIREALRILETQGIISLKRGPGGGPVVADYTGRDFARVATLHLQMWGATYGDLAESLVVTESQLARFAAERGRERAPLLRQANVRVRSASDDEEVRAGFRQFHELIDLLSGNSVLNLFASAIRVINRVQPEWSTVDGYLVSPEGCEQTVAEHEAITSAIGRGHAARAERLMRDHLTRQIAVSTQPADWRDEPVTWS